MEIRLRPTGCSLLVGLINLPPADYRGYERELRAVLERWSKTAIRKPDEGARRTKSDPSEFYRACGYIGLGAWNFITLTLVSEQGLATQMAYMGHVHGQRYFHAHDYSIVLPKSTGNTYKKLKTALDDMGLTYLEYHEGDVAKKDESRKVIFTKDYSYLATYHPLKLQQICSGRRSHYGAKATKEGKEGTSSLMPLLGLYKLKINPFLMLQEPKLVRLLCYVSVFLHLHSSYGNLRRKPAPNDLQMPFIRPMLTDGFFDMLVLTRCYDINSMEERLQQVKTLTVGCAKKLLQDYGIPTEALHSLNNRMSLFSLTYTVFGVPYHPIAQAQERFEHAFNADQTKDKDTKNEAGSGNPPDSKHKTVDTTKSLSEAYEALASSLKDYDERDKRTHKLLQPSTLVSLKTSGLSESFEKTILWQEITNLPEETGLFPHWINGRYDVELFPAETKISMSRLIASLQLAKALLNGPSYFRFRSEGDDTQIIKRIHSPLLEMKTKLTFGTPQLPDCPEPSKNAWPDRADGTDCETHLCVLTSRNLEDKLESVRKTLFASPKDTPQHDDNRLPRLQTRFEKLERFLIQDFSKNGTRIELGQAEFFDFFDHAFREEVTSETIEMVFTTLCALDGLLVDPLTMMFYLDVREYANHFLEGVLTATVDTKNSFAVEHWSTLSAAPERIGLRDHHFKGYEAWFIEVSSLIQKVIGQRQSGIYPQHDRNNARLSDLRLQHAKKMVAISWMINDFIEASQNDINTWLSIESEAGSSLSPVPENLNRPYLAFFSNAPEALMLRSQRSIGIDGRILTSTESIISLLHEIGHVVADEFLTPPDRWRMKLAERMRKTILLGPDQIEADKITKTKPLQTEIPMPDELGHDQTGSESISNKTKTRPTLLRPNSTKSWISVWDEVFCDIFVYHHCFAPNKDVERVLKAHLGKQMTNPEDGEFHQWFVMAWVFQIFLMAKIRTRTSFVHFILRISIILALLRAHARKELKSADFIWESDVSPFLKDKLPGLLDRLKRNDGSMQLPILEESFWMSVHDSSDDFEDVRSLFDEFIEVYRENRDSSPFFRYVERMIECSDPKVRAFSDLHDFFFYRSGMAPGNAKPDSASEHFSLAAQVAGMISLSYLREIHLDPTKVPLLVVGGYPGFEMHPSQQDLSRSRRLLSSLIRQGALIKMKEIVYPNLK